MGKNELKENPKPYDFLNEFLILKKIMHGKLYLERRKGKKMN